MHRIWTRDGLQVDRRQTGGRLEAVRKWTGFEQELERGWTGSLQEMDGGGQDLDRTLTVVRQEASSRQEINRRQT